METINPVAVLRAFVGRFPTKKAAAAELGISESYLQDLLRGRRSYSNEILKRLGLSRVVVGKGA